jgi:2C-methyl-D-erythritol 2,4-cyclodiphosphate synthase
MCESVSATTSTAIIDALLGAGVGDIGAQFPTSDPRQ